MPVRDLNKTNLTSTQIREQEYQSSLIDAVNGLKSELTVLGNTTVSWGEILGTISSQADLVAEFATKEDLLVNSAGLAASLSDEVGTGFVVFNNTPTLITPVLGAATGTSLQLSGLTASELLATDASKNLTSLAVATYPSLTQLSYVKGVTSSIQTQLDAKATATGVISGADWSGNDSLVGFSSTTSHTFRYSYDPNTKVCHCYVNFSGTSDSTSLTCTLPYTSIAVTHGNLCGAVTNNSVLSTVVGLVLVTASSTTATFTRDRNATGWTASGTKTWFGEFWYITT